MDLNDLAKPQASNRAASRFPVGGFFHFLSLGFGKQTGYSPDMDEVNPKTRKRYRRNLKAFC